jgi:peroxiredoxin
MKFKEIVISTKKLVIKKSLKMDQDFKFIIRKTFQLASLCSIILLSSIQREIYAQNVNKEVKSLNKATFKIKILTNHPEEYGLRIIFIRDAIISGVGDEDQFANNIRLEFKPNIHSEFIFDIQNLDHIGRLVIVVRKENTESQLGGSYYIEPGDQILVKIKDDSVYRHPLRESNGYIPIFYGQNSRKYTCCYKLNQIFRKFKTYGNDKFDNDSTEFVSLYNTCLNYNAAVFTCLSQFQPYLSKDAYLLIKAQAAGFPDWIYSSGILTRYYINYRNNLKMQKMLKEIYKQFPLHIDTANSNILFLSDQWSLATCNIIMTELTLSNGRRPTYTETFDYINNRFARKLKEKLFARFLLDPFTSRLLSGEDIVSDNTEILNLVDSAYYLSSTSFMKAFFKHTIVFSRGKNAYNFHLRDINNKTISLSDFRGKIVLLDTWGTGCGGCAIFYRWFTDSIVPKMKGDTSFAFVSICTDKKRDRWLKSVQSNLYTDESHINLTTSPYGEDSDYEQYYGFNTLPFILLIDKNGKIFELMKNNYRDPKKILDLFSLAENN